MPAAQEASSSSSESWKVWLRFFLFGLMYLAFGAFVFGYSLFDRWTYAQLLQRGATATAHVDKIAYHGNNDSDAYYIVELSWRDQSGALRTSQASLSIEFGRPIARGTKRPDITLMYLEDNSHARLLIIGDERQFDQTISTNTRWGLGLFLSSLALIILLYVIKRKRLDRSSSP